MECSVNSLWIDPIPFLSTDQCIGGQFVGLVNRRTLVAVEMTDSLID